MLTTPRARPTLRLAHHRYSDRIARCCSALGGAVCCRLGLQLFVQQLRLRRLGCRLTDCAASVLGVTDVPSSRSSSSRRPSSWAQPSAVPCRSWHTHVVGFTTLHPLATPSNRHAAPCRYTHLTTPTPTPPSPRGRGSRHFLTPTSGTLYGLNPPLVRTLPNHSVGSYP